MGTPIETTAAPSVDVPRLVLPDWEMTSADPEQWESAPREGWRYWIIFDGSMGSMGWIAGITVGTKYKKCAPFRDEAVSSMDDAKAVCLRHWQN